MMRGGVSPEGVRQGATRSSDVQTPFTDKA